MSSTVSIWSKPPLLWKPGVRRHQDAELPRPRLVEREPAERLAERAVQVDERGAVALPAVQDGRGAAVDLDRLRLAALARQQHPRPVAEFLQRLEHMAAPRGPTVPCSCVPA